MTFDAAIDPGQLMLARKRINDVIGIVEDIGSRAEAGELVEADTALRRAINECDEPDDTYEVTMLRAIDFTDEAVDSVEDWLQSLREMHAMGRVGASDETVGYCAERLRMALNDIVEWAEQQRRELRSLV